MRTKAIKIVIHVQKFDQIESAIKMMKDIQKKHTGLEVIIELAD
jgi:hypothetical protein